ncbi:3-oxoacyl-ACP reductase FabG [Pseudomonas sp. FW306-02-F02-AA]|uniref:Short-chain dehydrogenase n=1 Tax=Pseudomonas fluorescens TaxID=294 RepID=A0A0N9WNZ3_PSEFL|nr:MULTISPECIES: glucose 1-dehydrogenase [Pseudomonas]ALI03674.1 short-chain dehydrogenase [Pseudomonas fluorescens]PMZ00665.1 3-oxoacyl-ACP reductase FabG [Pseudomonas sp. FW306-02-F02-AB]PMZ06540.1 3-oxoacyl-ACP reductase FabG [Pseudomonas sp. FW306-02-H06C]PMZ12416.1 3-oxoacyl-ACP reductase FabG [Pseudomonas sp. FW306-02-F02-AA]PMZ19445.1 3-oxoacyl-ACP reductase FabG [Pseudomonas sp. FW306-02-F08-AA]
MKKLHRKIALVTGSSKGIGAAIARQLAKDGATVIVNYTRSREDADRVVSQILETGARAYAIRADVSNALEVKALFKAIVHEHGHIDILVNNAGVYATGALAEITEQEFNRQFNLNVLGLIQCTQEAVAVFNPKGGSIINISSSVTSFTPANSTVYTASKGAVDAITKTLANELGPKNIRVNSVNPGLVVTEGVHASGFFEDAFRQKIEAITPLGRIGSPEDIAPAVAFLASDDAGWITGEILVIGGGLH